MIPISISADFVKRFRWQHGLAREQPRPLAAAGPVSMPTSDVRIPAFFFARARRERQLIVKVRVTLVQNRRTSSKFRIDDRRTYLSSSPAPRTLPVDPVNEMRAGAGQLLTRAFRVDSDYYFFVVRDLSQRLLPRVIGQSDPLSPTNPFRLLKAEQLVSFFQSRQLH
jgi:hypothetical protein